MEIMLGVSTLNKYVNLKVDRATGRVLKNGEPFKLYDVDDFSREILRIISSWDEKMINNSILDGMTYYVNVKNNGSTYKFEGKNKFPDNFDEFMNILKRAKVYE